jgi:nicotinamidase-related amidase
VREKPLAIERLPDSASWCALGAPGRNSYRVSDTTVDMRRPPRAACSILLAAQPQQLVVDAARAAFVIVDMQNDFCAREGWIGSMGIDVAPAAALAEPINRVAAAFRRIGAPVIWLNWGVRPDRMNLSPGTQHPFNPNGKAPGLAGDIVAGPGRYHLLEEGGWGAQVIETLEQKPEDIRVSKHRISGFWDTPLDSILRNLDVTTLFFAGVNADHCVLGTLMDANFHGYDTILMEDCVATTSPDFCMQATLHNVRFCFGFTTSSEQLIAGFGEA